MNETSVVILVADGLSPGVLDAAIRDGEVPELAALRDESGMQVLTTVFPSVTGVAYVPMLSGDHPADAGIPGLRWYDRSRRLPALLGSSRSYVGPQIHRLNGDLVPHVRTAFERVNGNALGSGAMITRGLVRHRRLDRGLALSARALRAHLSGDIGRWAAIEEQLGDTLVGRIRRERPRFVFASFTTGDKAAHAHGAGSAESRRALGLVDRVAAAIRHDAERDGRWSAMHLWVVSDHGHSPVLASWDLADAMRARGVRTRSHPWTVPDRSQCAVMVSGNSMAHVYFDLGCRTRRAWPELERRWSPELEAMMAHPAVDLVATKRDSGTILVRRRGETASIATTGQRFSYRLESGNPLGAEPFEDATEDEAHERTMATGYPDGVVQLSRLGLAERSGDVIVSAASGWDLRRRYEPIVHVSSHGALHAAHMLVPLVGNRRFADRARRTADLYRWLVGRLA